MKLSSDNIEFYTGKLTVIAYWPYLNISARYIHIGFPTQVLYQDRRSWAWDKSIVMRILGFGVGIVLNHCDNPNYEQPPELYDNG